MVEINRKVNKKNHFLVFYLNIKKLEIKVKIECNFVIINKNVKGIYVLNFNNYYTFGKDL
jgi:hypothetical protein